jgi:hypothetical protein
MDPFSLSITAAISPYAALLKSVLNLLASNHWILILIYYIIQYSNDFVNVVEIQAKQCISSIFYEAFKYNTYE